MHVIYAYFYLKCWKSNDCSLVTETAVMNTLWHFSLQLCFAGPIVNFIFGKIFNENGGLVSIFYFTKEKTFAQNKEDRGIKV